MSLFKSNFMRQKKMGCRALLCTRHIGLYQSSGAIMA